MFESSSKSRKSWNGRQRIGQCIPNIWSNRRKWFGGFHGEKDEEIKPNAHTFLEKTEALKHPNDLEGANSLIGAPAVPIMRACMLQASKEIKVPKTISWIWPPRLPREVWGSQGKMETRLRLPRINSFQGRPAPESPMQSSQGIANEFVLEL